MLVVWGCDVGLLGLAYLGLLVPVILFPPRAARFVPPGGSKGPGPDVVPQEGFQALLAGALRGRLSPSREPLAISVPSHAFALHVEV